MKKGARESRLTLENERTDFPGITFPALFKRITDFTKAGQRPVTIAEI